MLCLELRNSYGDRALPGNEDRLKPPLGRATNGAPSWLLLACSLEASIPNFVGQHRAAFRI